MNRERFENLADAYGGDIARWPAELRAEAAELALVDAAWASQVRGEAGRMDAVLAMPPLTVPADLVGRILAAAPSRRVFPAWTRWLAPASLTAACVAGMVLGAQVPRIVTDGDGVVTAVADDELNLFLDEEA